MFRLIRINKHYHMNKKYLFSTSVKNISLSVLYMSLSYWIIGSIYEKEDEKIKVKFNI